MKTLIISEIGVNHDGSFEKLKKLVSLSKKIGADVVKLQVYNSSELVIKKSRPAHYQKKLEKISLKF